MSTNISPFTVSEDSLTLRYRTALLVIHEDGSLEMGLNNAEPAAMDIGNVVRILRICDGQTSDGAEVLKLAIARRDDLDAFFHRDEDGLMERVLGDGYVALQREQEILHDADLDTLQQVYDAMANARSFKQVKKDGEAATQRAEALQSELDEANETITNLREANGELTTRAETAEGELARIRGAINGNGHVDTDDASLERLFQLGGTELPREGDEETIEEPVPANVTG